MFSFIQPNKDLEMPFFKDLHYASQILVCDGCFQNLCQVLEDQKIPYYITALTPLKCAYNKHLNNNTIP